VYESLNTPPGAVDVTQYIEKMITTAKELENKHENKGGE
jgi:ribosomal protein L17